MIFNQRDSTDSSYSARGQTHSYCSSSLPENLGTEITTYSHAELRPLSNHRNLTDRIFGVVHPEEADPLGFPKERADIQKNQIDVLLRQLDARHAINYRIRKTHAYLESFLGSELLRVKDGPYFSDLGGKRQSSLEKELIGLDRERWAEEVSCWRDTNRILNDVFDH